MNPVVAFTLLVAGTATLTVPLPVALTAPASAPVQVNAYTTEVSVAPGGAVQEFTLDCKPGESVLSGGFRHTTPELRVLASYPSPVKAAWVVSAALPARTPADLTLSVVCGAGDVRSSVRVATGARPSVSTRCPEGTIVTGGGYSSGNAAFHGSYPAVGEGWAVTAMPLPGNEAPNLTVYAVCAAGSVRPASAGMQTLELPAATTQSPCPSTTTTAAAACAYNRSGGREVSCEGTLVGGGYEVAEGLMPPFSVTGAAVIREAWQVTVNGRGTDSQPLSMRIIAICVLLPEPEPPASAPQVRQEPVAQRDEILPIIASSCLVAALLMALILVMSARMKSRTRKGQSAQVAVVLRSHHSSFRLDEFREVQ